LNLRSETLGATFPYLAQFPFVLHCGSFRNNWHGKDRNHPVLLAWAYAARLGPSYLQAPLGLQPWACLPFVDIDLPDTNPNTIPKHCPPYRKGHARWAGRI
jgi:hypothetical protein